MTRTRLPTRASSDFMRIARPSPRSAALRTGGRREQRGVLRRPTAGAPTPVHVVEPSLPVVAGRIVQLFGLAVDLYRVGPQIFGQPEADKQRDQRHELQCSLHGAPTTNGLLYASMLDPVPQRDIGRLGIIESAVCPFFG